VPDATHPARRPSRYHWAAGTNALHWAPALAGWAGCGAAALLAAGGTPQAGLATSAALACALFSVGWSTLWLLILPSNSRFRRVVDSQLLAKYGEDFAYQLDGLKPRINRNLALKVRDITALRDKTRQIMQNKFGALDPFAQDNLVKLDRLAINYLQLLATLTDYDDYLALVDAPHLEADLAAAQKDLDEADRELAPIRQRQLLLLQNRLLRYRKVEARIKVLGGEAANIETTLRLLMDQAMTAADSQRVGQDIDAVLTNMKESELLAEDLAVFDELERSVGTLGKGKESH
jgi:hypothetical protein